MNQRSACSRSNLFHRAALGLACALALGCTSSFLQSPATPTVDAWTPPGPADGPQLIGDVATPWGMNWLKIEGVALVTQLAGTGSNPPNSPLRDQLEKEMQSHQARNITSTLASPNTALVMVRGIVPPAAQKNDTFDVDVQTPPRAETTSLAGGWLMQTRLRELRVLDNSLRSSDVAGVALGNIYVDALFKPGDEKVNLTRGRVPGGGIVSKSRSFGLMIHGDYRSVQLSVAVASAINQRFHRFDHGQQNGVANPTRDNTIELSLHPQYRHNLTRYIRVIRNIAYRESPVERVQRLLTLEKMLQEPTSSELAAVQLEAIGNEAIPALRRGLESPDVEVRFHAAEALAYLDQYEATPALYEVARDVRAFRWRALAALTVIDNLAAEERLADLMGEDSAETRYGAFQALRLNNGGSPLVRGEVLGDQFAFHQVASGGPPLIHFARVGRPEIVMFGAVQPLRPPTFLYAGKQILIKATADGRLRLSKFTADGETEHAECDAELGALVRSVVQMGGKYGDVLAAVQEAGRRGYLDSRVAINALPRGDRTYHRGEAVAEREAEPPPAADVPEMFLDRLSGERGSAGADEPPVDIDAESVPAESAGALERVTSWFFD